MTFAPHDKSAAHSLAGRERSRRALNASVGSVVLRVSTLMATLGATAIATREYSSTDVATWFILISLTALQGIADLGIMARLTTSVAEVQDPTGTGLGTTKALYSSAIRSATKLSALIGLGVGLIGVLLLTFWSGEVPASDTQLAVLCFVVIALLTVPFQGPLRLLHGLQNGLAANISLAASYFFVLIAVVAIWVLGDLSFPVFVSLTSSSALLGGIFAGIILRVATPVRFAWRSGDQSTSVRKMAYLSSPYLVIAMSSLVAFSSDQLVLGVLGNSKQVAEYATSYRIFTQVPITAYLALTSLWPAAANARVEGDARWIHRTTARTWKLSILATGLAAIPLLMFGKQLISWWTGGTVAVPLGLLFVCALYSIVNAAWSPLHFALMGQGLVTFMARCMVRMAVLNVVISASLVKPLGASGPVVGSTISLGIMVVLPYFRIYRRTAPSNS